jgi:hypothetical protein
MLAFLNIFFFVFHTGWIVFNMVGWAWRRTRPYHLVTLGLTAFSWLVLGYWYGFGYCVCTDWHWQIRQRLGYVDIDRSYTHFLIHQITGLDLSYLWTDILTGAIFGIAIILNLMLSFCDSKQRRIQRSQTPTVEG